MKPPSIRPCFVKCTHYLLSISMRKKIKDIDISAISELVIGGIYHLNLHRDRSKFAEIDLNTKQERKRHQR